MKKIMVLVLAAAMLLSLAACGGGTSGGNGPSAGGNREEGTQRPAGQGVIPEAFPLQAAIEETVLVDEKDVKITATELTYTGGSAELTLLLENNSGQELTFASHNNCIRSVNGYMVSSGYMNEKVAPGKMATGIVSFGAEELLLMGITDIADIGISFELADDNYKTYLAAGPCEIRTSIADSYDYSADPYQAAINSGVFAAVSDCSLDFTAMDELLDAGGVKVISAVLTTNGDDERTLVLETENTLSQAASVGIGDIYLNDVMLSTSWIYELIGAGKRSLIALPISSMMEDAYWDIYGLREIGSIAISVKAQDADDDILGNEEICLTIPGAGTDFDASGAEVYRNAGLSLIYKGLTEDGSSCSEDVHMLFLVENGSSGPIDVQVSSGSCSINGFMTDAYCFDREIAPGRNRIMDVRIDGDSLKKNGINSIADITEFEMGIELKNRPNHAVAEAVVTVPVSG